MTVKFIYKSGRTVTVTGWTDAMVATLMAYGDGPKFEIVSQDDGKCCVTSCDNCNPGWDEEAKA